MLSPTHDEILRPRKGKWALVLLGSAAFVATGFWMVTDSPSERFWGYAGIIFFGLCLVIALIQFIPGSSFLRLTADGITVRAMWRTTFYRWSDIARFGAAEFTTFGARQRFVGLDFSATYPHRDRAQTVKKINRALIGFEGTLPDNYGWDYAELAAHLNRLREQYVTPVIR
jgi:PH (Pleckstrin Homology) domain-containing protein